MDRQGKFPTKNKRKKNKKKNQDANGAGRNDQPIQLQVQDGKQEQNARAYDTTKPEPVHVQQKGHQHINLGQPNEDKNKATNQVKVSKSANFSQGILNAESLQTKEIQEMKQTVSDEMDKVAKLLVEQMQEINKSQQTFDLRVFGSSEMNPEERAKETQKAILYLAEKMRLRGKCAPQTLLDKQEERLQEICFRYDELSKLLQRLEDLEDGGIAHNTKGAHKPLAAREEINGQELKGKFLKTCRPKRFEQPCQPTSKHNEEQNTPPTNFKTTQNVPGKVYPSEKVLGGSHHGAANIGDGNLDDGVLLRSSPKNEDEKSNVSQQQLSSDDSNELLAFQAFAAPMKFLRRVKKKVGNLFFTPKKEKVKENFNEANGDNIHIDRAVALGGAGLVLPQPVQRTFIELQNDTVHGNGSNKRGLEQILVAPEGRVSLTIKTTMVQGREEKETKGGPPTGVTTHENGFRAAEIGITGKNADNKNVHLKEKLPIPQTLQRNGVESIKVKTAAEVKKMGVEGRSQGAVKQKVVPAASQSGVKQMSQLEKRDVLSKSATPLTTIPEKNTKQTAPGVKVAGKVNLPADNIEPNLTPQASPKNVRGQHQNASVTSASPKIFHDKTSIPITAVGVSASNAALDVPGGSQSKNQKSSQPQPQLVLQNEPRKDVISKTPAYFVATKGKVLEEKTVNSPGKPSQEPKDAIVQIALTKKTSPAPNYRQQGTSSDKQGNPTDGCKSPKGILKKEKPSSSRVPQIAASLPPSPKATPVANHTNVAVQEVKSSNHEADVKHDTTQASSSCERRILKARRRITFEEDHKPEETGTAELSAITEEVDYETVMPEEFEQAVAEAMEDESFSEQSPPKEKQSNRPIHTRSYAPLQDIPESSALDIKVDAAQTMQARKKKKNRGKYATGFANPRKSINCCCEYNCDYCVPAWEWDKVVANQRRKR